MAVYELRLGGRHHCRVDRNVSYVDYPVVLREKGLNNLGGGGSGVQPPAQPDENDRARAWAMEKGITDGENPDSPATRQQVWTMLYRMNGGK